MKSKDVTIGQSLNYSGPLKDDIHKWRTLHTLKNKPNVIFLKFDLCDSQV